MFGCKLYFLFNSIQLNFICIALNRNIFMFSFNKHVFRTFTDLSFTLIFSILFYTKLTPIEFRQKTASSTVQSQSASVTQQPNHKAHVRLKTIQHGGNSWQAGGNGKDGAKLILFYVYFLKLHMSLVNDTGNCAQSGSWRQQSCVISGFPV